MTKERIEVEAVLRLALEDLKWIKTGMGCKDIDATIQAIEEALAQPAVTESHKQEPVAWANRVIGGRKWLSIHASKGASDRWLEYRTKEQAQGEEYEQVALYTTPPQRKPLTDEQLDKEFEAYAAQFDTFSDEWQDMGAGDYFKAGFKAAHGIKE